jgi:hypothetical protein
MSAFSILSNASTVDDSPQSQIKVACKRLDLSRIKLLLDQDQTGRLHRTTDSNDRTLLDLAIKNNSSVDPHLFETVCFLLQNKVDFTLKSAQHQDTYGSIKKEIKSRRKRGQ